MHATVPHGFTRRITARRHRLLDESRVFEHHSDLVQREEPRERPVLSDVRPLADALIRREAKHGQVVQSVIAEAHHAAGSQRGDAPAQKRRRAFPGRHRAEHEDHQHRIEPVVQSAPRQSTIYFTREVVARRRVAHEPFESILGFHPLRSFDRACRAPHRVGAPIARQHRGAWVGGEHGQRG